MNKLLYFCLCFFIPSMVQAQVKVYIGGLYYNLSGNEASVTYDRSKIYNSGTYFYPSNYNWPEYVVPSSVSYNGNNYSVTEIGEGAFAAAYAKYEVGGGWREFYTDHYVSSGVTYVIKSIKKIVLSNNIPIVKEAAFYGQQGLECIEMPGVQSIGKEALSHCTSLTTISMPNVKVIGSNAFSFCNSLISIKIPETATSFNGNPFDGCSLLKEIWYLSTTPPKNWTATTFTYVPDIKAYSSPSYSMNQAKIIEMISFKKKTFVYTGQSPTTTWTNNVEGYTVSLTMPTLKKEVGEYKAIIPATFTKGEESFTANVVYRYTITPVNLTVKASNVSREYGEENPSFTLSYSGFINGENESVLSALPTLSTTATKSSDVGEYPITVSGGSAKNYTLVYKPGNLTINKAPLTARVDDAKRQYGTRNPAFTVSYNGLKNGETVPKWSTTLKFETSASALSEVGTYTISATGVPVNYNLSKIESGTLTITPAPLTIKANDATRKYFEDEPSFTYSCTGFVNGDDVGMLTKKPSLTTDATIASNVGKYKITPSGAEAKNYTMSYEQGELTIMKRPLTATSHCSRLYGEENPLLPIEYIGFVNAETENVITTKPIATTTAKKTSPVGEYPITVSGGEATNYDFVYEQGVLNVTKASLSAKVKDATKVYGTQNPSFSIEYYGLKNGETAPAWVTSPTFQTDASQSSGVGQYVVRAVNGVPVNYDLGDIATGTLSVTPAPLTIKANNAVRQYYSDDPTFSYTCSGFVNGEDESVLAVKPSLSTTAVRTSNVGTYEIRIGEASSPNYSISNVNGTLTITPRTLTASVGNYERKYNEENPVFKIEYDGFVGNEDENVLISSPEAKTTAKKTSDVGTYPINVSGGSADNYTFNYTSGILTINKAEQTISWEQDLSALSVDDQVELKAEASSGLPIAYTIDQTDIAEIYSTANKYYLDCKGEGTFQIVAVQNGNKNYYSTTRIRKTVTIGSSSGINEMDNSQVKVQRTPYGLRVIDANVGDVIRVYTLDGVLQHSIRVDSKNVDIPLNRQDVYIIKVGGKTQKIGFR